MNPQGRASLLNDPNTTRPNVSTSARLLRWRAGAVEPAHRVIPEETPIALVHDAETTAVMMATPADLEDFGVGFSLTEGLIESVQDIRSIEVVEASGGIELRMWMSAGRSAALAARRRTLVGPTGCGLCGIDALDAAIRPLPMSPSGIQFEVKEIQSALTHLNQAQKLGAATRAVHAAAIWTRDRGLEFVREDVGRHNALDKTIGAVTRAGAPANAAAVVLTSRVSVEMIQKSAVLGAPVLIAVSAPTALAVRTANDCGMTLIAVARDDGFEVFTHPERLES